MLTLVIGSVLVTIGGFATGYAIMAIAMSYLHQRQMRDGG